MQITLPNIHPFILLLISFAFLIVHIILTVIVLIKLKKTGNDDVIKATETIIKKAAKAVGITCFQDILDLLPEIKKTVETLTAAEPPPASDETKEIKGQG